MGNWYDNIKWIGDYRFPLQHEGKSYRDILINWVTEYINKIENCVILQNSDIEKIKDFSMGLIKCYDLYLDTKFFEAYSYFDYLMNSVKDLLLYIDIGKKDYYCNITDSYYRIRTGEKSFNYKEMLHIPLKNRCFASNNRFSVPGMPCSYLANESIICWYECGMPVNFQIAKYDVDFDNLKGKKLLQLGINPLQTKVLLRQKFYDKISEKDVKDYINSVCYTLPLIAACSVVVENKSVNFIEEYIIPQMLMVWIKSTTEVAGVRYNSDVKNELARNMNAYNIAIPVRDDKDSGYCSYLISLFKNDMNEKSKTIEIKKYILDDCKQIKLIEEFYYKVDWNLKHLSTNDLKQDLVDIDALEKIADFTQNLLVLLEQLEKEDVNLTYAIVLTIYYLPNIGKMIENENIDKKKVSSNVENIKKEFSNTVLKFVEELKLKFSHI